MASPLVVMTIEVIALVPLMISVAEKKLHGAFNHMMWPNSILVASGQTRLT